jgi:hypothetical protein
LPPELRRVNVNAAGIDIGAGHHYVAVPEGRDPQGGPYGSSDVSRTICAL